MKVMKKLAVVMVALATVIAVAGTGISVEAAAKAPKKITLKVTSKTVDINETATVSVKSVSPKGASTAVKFQSSDKKIATVSSKGVVTGKKVGTVTITATSQKNKKVKATIKITVTDVQPTSISFAAEEISKDADGYMLSAAKGNVAAKNEIKVVPAKATAKLGKITYASSDEKIVTVAEDGTVTTVAKGEATITATTEKGLTASYKVKVTDRAEESINWQYKSAADAIKEAGEGSLIVVDTRPETISPGGTDNGFGYKYGHIKGSIWVSSWPVDTKASEDALRGKVEELKKSEKPIAIVCQSGQGGAKRAISVLKEAGIAESRLYILTGGGKELITNHGASLEKN